MRIKTENKHHKNKMWERLCVCIISHIKIILYFQYIPAEGESVESYDEGAYKTLHFGDISSQLTPPDTPQEL